MYAYYKHTLGPEGCSSNYWFFEKSLLCHYSLLTLIFALLEFKIPHLELNVLYNEKCQLQVTTTKSYLTAYDKNW